MRQLIEVRVLGTFMVRTADGELVGERAWRTAKTRDLLRLLAVAGKPVPVDRLIDVLWPGAEPAHGRGSLRTAASQVRHVLGEGCLVRRGEALELTGAWVDAAAFAARAATARHRLADGDVGGGLAAAWEAVVLYGGDLCDDVTSADWPCEDRDHLRQLLLRLLVEAGEGACALGWWRDAVELGHLALDVDPCTERAYRVLMSAYSGLGETEQALRMFERCRRTLVEQFGADPDGRTQALHLQLLRPRTPPAPTAPLVARGPVLAQVRTTMAEVVEQGRPRAMVVTGPTGIGRTRFLGEAAASWSHRVVSLSCGPAGTGQPGALVREIRQALGAGPAPRSPAVEDLRGLLSGEPLLLVVDDVQLADAESLVVLGRLLLDAAEPLLVLTAAPAGLPRGHPLTTSCCGSLELPAFAREEVAELLTQVLKGAPSRGLVDELADGSHGRPGELLDAVRRLLGSGQLLTTADGMVRVPRSRGGGRAPAAGPLLAAARERVGPAGAGVLDLLAVLDRPATLPELSRVGGLGAADAQAALDQLCDLQLVVGRPTGYTLADPLVREAAYRWLRPSARRELHRRVAELAYVPAAVRAEHWLGAGEPALACAAALEAADEAAAVGDDVQLRTQLRTVRAFSEQHADGGGDVVLLRERLAEVAVRLGRRWEAQELVEQAPASTRSGAPARLPDQRGHRVRPRPTRGAPPRSAAADDGWTTAAGPPHHTVLAVDDAGDVASRIEARIRLARAAGRRREFALAERSAKDAMALAEGVRDDALFVRSALSLVQVPALLGDGLRHRELLRRIWVLGATGRAEESADRLALTWCVVLHDLGSPDFERTWRQTTASVRDAEAGRLHALLEVHLCLETDQPGRARLLLDRLDGPYDPAVADDAMRILRARLLVREGDIDGAARSLGSVLAEQPSGPSLLAPEAGARLSALLASRDLDAARTQLEQARSLAGECTFPREQVLMLRAGAELLLAEGNPSGAATVALAAAMTAARAGLVVSEAEARARHHHLLGAAGVRHQPVRQARPSDLDSLVTGSER